jgi:hypothetical protein
MGKTRAKWRGGQLAFYDGTTHETVLPLAPIVLYDDFLGGAVNGDLWTEVDTNDATKAIGGSVLTYHLHATGETEDAGIYGKDDKSFNLDKGVIFEARVAIHVAPTSVAEVMIGVQDDSYGTASNRILGADEVTKYAAFGFYTTVGSGLIPVIRTDDGSVNSGIINSGFGAVVLDAYHIYRIDFTDITNVLFYIDGEGVAKTTTFSMATGSNIMVQPVVMADKKTADTGLGDIYVDYIKVWQATR